LSEDSAWEGDGGSVYAVTEKSVKLRRSGRDQKNGEEEGEQIREEEQEQRQGLSEETGINQSQARVQQQ